MKGGMEGASASSSHIEEPDDEGESKAILGVVLNGVIDDIFSAAPAPMAPPGWKLRNTSAGLLPGAVCSSRAMAMANASPRHNATAVDEVGAPTPSDVSSLS